MSLITKPFDESWIKVTRINFNDVLYEPGKSGQHDSIKLCKGFIYYHSYEDQSFIQHQLHDGIHPDKLEPWLSDGRIFLEKIVSEKKEVNKPVEKKESDFDWI